MYKLGIAKDSCNEDAYISQVTDLINKTRIMDRSVVHHTQEELSDRYKASVICLLQNNKIIGNSSVFPTTIQELQGQNIGEIGSVITDINYRGRGIGGKLIHETIRSFADNFSCLVGATINQKMYKILLDNGFQEETFPQSCFIRGKKYLSPLLIGGEQEFIKKAKFFRKNINRS